MKKQLAALVDQIKRGSYFDDQGMDLTLNVAYLDAVKELEGFALHPEELGNRLVGEVMDSLAEMNAATAKIVGTKNDGTPLYAVMFIRGEETTADVLALLEAYEDEDGPKISELDAAVNAAAEELADAGLDDTRGVGTPHVEKLVDAVEARRAFHEERRTKAEDAERRAALRRLEDEEEDS